MSIQLKKKAAEAVESVEKVSSLRRFVPKAVSVRAGRTGLHLQKASPEILFGAGLVLGVATVVTACRATLKLEGVLEDLQSDIQDTKNLEEAAPEKYTAEDGLKDRAYLYTRGSLKMAKLYGPSFILGVSSVAALTGSHHILNKRNVAITAAYAAVEKSFNEYRGRVADEFGTDRERELRYGVTEYEDPNGKVGKNGKKKLAKTFGTVASPYCRVWDEVTSTQWKNNSHSNRTFIQCQQNWANDMLHSRGHLFLNEVHDMLGLERSTAGQAVGWVLGNGDNYVDFGIFDRQHSDERVHEFMFGQEKSVLLDFNVDGPVYQLLDELKTNK